MKIFEKYEKMSKISEKNANKSQQIFLYLKNINIPFLLVQSQHLDKNGPKKTKQKRMQK